MINRAEIDDLKAKFRIEDIVRMDTTLDIEASSYEGTLKGPCPWCGGHDRFHVHPKPGNWWCRQCGRKGNDIFAYWMQRYGVDFKTACKQLQAALGLAVYKKIKYDRLNLWGVMPKDYKSDGDSIVASYKTEADFRQHALAIKKRKQELETQAELVTDDRDAYNLVLFALALGGEITGVDYA